MHPYGLVKCRADIGYRGAIHSVAVLSLQIVATSSSHLDIGKVHLRVLRLELLQDVELLLLVARGLACLLLPLVEHHLLDHAACLAVEIAQLAVLRLDLAGVDLGGRGDDVRPPLHLVDLVEVDLNVLA